MRQNTSRVETNTPEKQRMLYHVDVVHVPPPKMIIVVVFFTDVHKTICFIIQSFFDSSDGLSAPISTVQLLDSFWCADPF